jgi:hypothetical protein
VDDGNTGKTGVRDDPEIPDPDFLNRRSGVRVTPGVQRFIFIRYFEGVNVKRSRNAVLFVCTILLLPALALSQTDDAGDTTPNIAGTWSLGVVTDGGVLMHDGTFELDQRGNTVKGRYVTGSTEYALMGKCSDAGEILLKQREPISITLETRETQKSYSVVLEFKGTLNSEGTRFNGERIATDIESGTIVFTTRFTATKQ